jgi:hypothetical protein
MGETVARSGSVAPRLELVHPDLVMDDEFYSYTRWEQCGMVPQTPGPKWASLRILAHN